MITAPAAGWPVRDEMINPAQRQQGAVSTFIVGLPPRFMLLRLFFGRRMLEGSLEGGFEEVLELCRRRASSSRMRYCRWVMRRCAEALDLRFQLEKGCAHRWREDLARSLELLGNINGPRRCRMY